MHQQKVYKQVLANGLSVIVVPRHIVPKVSIQLWYNVGSKDEKSGEKGIAHLIEHMIFKGTNMLSECDINLITHKLSGYCNAFTSYDYTGYLFDFPSQHWQEALPIMADCMRNCTFKQEFLNSELKAVIQELKMYKDDYVSNIIENLISSIFADHPYHHPIIGYKQDLWTLDRESLVNFYKRHYVPNNAILVLTGDINPEQVWPEVHKYFGNIAPDLDYKPEKYYHSPDLKNYSIVTYKDIKQPLVVLAWVIPGATAGQDYVIDIANWIIGSGNGSRLYKKLVDEYALVTEFELFNYDLFDYGLLFAYFTPKKQEDIDKIINIINQELSDIAHKTVEKAEIVRAIKKTEVEHLALLENNQKQAYAIGKYFLALGDENFLYNYTNYPKENLEEEVKKFVSTYLRPSLMHQGRVLPLADEEKKYWLKLQDISDAEDARILSGRTRDVEVEEGKCVFNIKVQDPKLFDFPKSKTFYLKNGLKVLHYNNKYLPKIDLILDFKARSHYDPDNLPGLSNFVAHMLTQGTKNYTATAFADVLESYGMSLSCQPGRISLSMLSVDLPKGLELLGEIVYQATFDEQAIERVRSQLIADLNQFWDTPSEFVIQLVKEKIYKKHPYAKNPLGTYESLEAIVRQDLVDFYNNYITPKESMLAIVGNLERYDLKEVFEHMLSRWHGKDVPDLDFPALAQPSTDIINYEIMRDQIVLCYAGLSVSRLDPDYDKLLLFDQIFGGGILGSMSSRLFDLRERSGLFYTIGGSLIARVNKQPGMILVKTIVSADRLKEAEKSIENVIDTAIDSVTQEEFAEAQRAVINSLVDNFASNGQIANTLLFKEKYNLPVDYFDKRAEQLSAITIEQMQQTVRKYLRSDKFIKARVGRIN